MNCKVKKKICICNVWQRYNFVDIGEAFLKMRNLTTKTRFKTPRHDVVSSLDYIQRSVFVGS